MSAVGFTLSRPARALSVDSEMWIGSKRLGITFLRLPVQSSDPVECVGIKKRDGHEWNYHGSYAPLRAGQFLRIRPRRFSLRSRPRGIISSNGGAATKR
jgi:hypothetical protein